jgi:tetratricopeptide (TPR) repeat protein
MRLNHAVALANAGKGEEAIQEFQSLVSDYPGDAASLNSLGFALLSFHSAEEALPVLVKAVECDSTDVKARTNLGKALFSAGRSGEALQVWESCIADGTQDPAPYILSARLLAHSQDLTERTVGLERALSAVRLSGSMNAAALEALAESYASLGKNREAIDLILKSASMMSASGQENEAMRLRTKAMELSASH